MEPLYEASIHPEGYGVRWQAKRDTALALETATFVESGNVLRRADDKAPSPLRFAGALHSAAGKFMAPTRVEMRRRSGFTLIELMAAIGIIALLASLLFPALGTAQRKVRDIACLGNLKQWGIATALYAIEHDDSLPPDGVPNPTERSTNTGWYIQLPRQMGLPSYHQMPWRTNPAFNPGRSIWICPANPRRSNGRNLFHYCQNEHVNGTGSANRAIRLSSIRKPALVPWLFDSKNLPAVGYWSFVHTNLHAHGSQFLFLDGHARWFRNDAYWDFGADKGRTNNPDLLWIP
jgi:prepilin-type N-terminal cleavage/methylation domain-containing protein/prepilin-type processing-associated H-X9-DG protein